MGVCQERLVSSVLGSRLPCERLSFSAQNKEHGSRKQARLAQGGEMQQADARRAGDVCVKPYSRCARASPAPSTQPAGDTHDGRIRHDRRAPKRGWRRRQLTRVGGAGQWIQRDDGPDECQALHQLAHLPSPMSPHTFRPHPFWTTPTDLLRVVGVDQTPLHSFLRALICADLARAFVTARS